MPPAIKVGTIHWRGAGVVTYPYEIYDIHTILPVRPGNYVWAMKVAGTDTYRPLYAGESDNLQTRVTQGHEHYAGAVRAGATHITFHAHQVDDRAARLAEESAIRARYNPTCNRQ